jgi:hypothetical protein
MDCQDLAIVTISSRSYKSINNTLILSLRGVPAKPGRRGNLETVNTSAREQQSIDIFINKRRLDNRFTIN